MMDSARTPLMAQESSSLEGNVGHPANKKYSSLEHRKKYQDVPSSNSCKHSKVI